MLLLTLQALSALAITLALIVGCAWLARRYAHVFTVGKPTNKKLQLVEKLALGATTLYLVRAEGEQHLIATTATQTTLLSTKKKNK